MFFFFRFNSSLAGISRSPTLVIAYLMKTQNLSFSEAFDLVKKKRPIIHPNQGFKNQLLQYEQQLKNNMN
jgi:protein-tyrosine phosphatase